MIIRSYLDDLEVNNPNNLSELILSIDVTEEGTKVLRFEGEPTWGRGDLRSPNDAYLLLDKYINDGASGGVGVAQARRYKMVAEELGRSILVIESLVDLWSSEKNEETREISTPIMEAGGSDWITSNTQGLSFEYLKSINRITEDDTVLAPYVLEKETPTSEKILAIVTGVVITSQINDQIQAIKEIVSDTTSVSPWVAVAKIILRVAYITVLIKTLLDTLFRVINLLIQPVKYVCGMTVKRHFEILFDYLGYRFQSSIFNSDEQYLTLFPERYSNPKNKELDNIKGWVKPDKSRQEGYYKGYGYDFCMTFKQFYNAKFMVDHDNKTVRFERKDYIGKISSFIPPKIWQKTRLNKEDFFANHLFEFRTDLNDRHTIQEYSGTSSSVNIRAQITDPSASLVTGGKVVSIPFSLFKIKTQLSDVEEIVKGLLKTIDATLNVLITVVNAAISAINAILRTINKILKALAVVGIKLNVKLGTIKPLSKVNLAESIENRVGMFKMEDDILYTPKLAYVRPTNPRNTKQLKPLYAQDIQETYHSIDYFTRGNQFRKNSGIGIAINFDQIYDIINSDQLGDGSSLVSLKWKLFDHQAEIVTKEPYTYLTGLIESRIISDGN